MRIPGRPFLRAIVALYLVALVVVAVLVDRLGDVWWPATALMFAPRWIWGLPLAVLGPIALGRGRRAFLVPLAGAALVLLGPILDLRVPVGRLAHLGRTRDLRFLSYNVGGGFVDSSALNAWMALTGVDVAAMAERDDPAGIDGMQLRCERGTCIASRYPVVREDRRDRSDLVEQGGSGAILRFEVKLPRGKISVTSVHLATTRDGIDAVMHDPWKGGPVLSARSRERAIEAEAARAWAARSTLPTIVAGDFNTPVESAIYRRTWSGLTNAFSAAGLGFGRSKYTRWHGVRIDHILVGPGWEVLSSWVGPGFGGDHRPVLADLRWVGPG